MKGRNPFMESRSGDMRGARSNGTLLPRSFGVCPKGARKMMFSYPSAARTRSGLAASFYRQNMKNLSTS